MYIRFTRRLRTASSISHGIFVAAMMSNRSPAVVVAPSTCTMNSVFNRRDASCSFSLRTDMRASISSKKITLGCCSRAISNSAFISFSPSPRYLEVTLEAEMEKKQNPDSLATALANRVLPVPGGPKRSTPFGGLRSPVNKSGRKLGKITASCRVCFAYARPAISSQRTLGDLSNIPSRICASYSFRFFDGASVSLTLTEGAVEGVLVVLEVVMVPELLRALVMELINSVVGEGLRPACNLCVAACCCCTAVEVVLVGGWRAVWIDAAMSAFLRRISAV
mmetsp:Transcript_22594/g.39013  ORF Transcript_22594/g.39013 Transcript_22594/m.39013 type:complete len:279 (-) Transcript_22594:491-1327(-)